MKLRPEAVLALFAMAALLPGADQLATVFEHIDSAAKTFRGMTADITNTQYTALVDDKDVQSGSIKLLRVKPDLTRLLVDLKGAHSAESLALDGHVFRMYKPKTNVVDEFDIAGKQGLINRYLLLGFGATSSELKSSYDVTYGGDEKVGNQPTTRIVLVPKLPETRHDLKQAELWIGENGLVVQQKFLQPAGDYKLVTYSNMKLGAMPEKDLELKVPKNATVQKDHQ